MRHIGRMLALLVAMLILVVFPGAGGQAGALPAHGHAASLAAVADFVSPHGLHCAGDDEAACCRGDAGCCPGGPVLAAIAPAMDRPAMSDAEALPSPLAGLTPQAPMRPPNG